MVQVAEFYMLNVLLKCHITSSLFQCIVNTEGVDISILVYEKINAGCSTEINSPISVSISKISLIGHICEYHIDRYININQDKRIIADTY